MVSFLYFCCLVESCFPNIGWAFWVLLLDVEGFRFAAHPLKAFKQKSKLVSFLFFESVRIAFSKQRMGCGRTWGVSSDWGISIVKPTWAIARP